MMFRVICILLCMASAGWAQTKLHHAPAPVDNPLQGLVPYVHAGGTDRFPHSLEFHYFSLAELMTGPQAYDFTPIEHILSITRKRGCQLVLRIYMEYPGKQTGVPKFLIDGGLKTIRWTNPDDGKTNITPDYSDPKLRNAIKQFISAFGKKYDGDPRLGYLTAGLLGSWGEWHTHPREDLWASKTVQAEVLDAYEAAFRKTPVLLRYPAGSKDARHTPNAQRNFGYHDDSFAWATLETGKKQDGWFFESLLKNAGALDKWKTHPIGGEIRPELWKRSFTDRPHPKGQDFVQCVQRTHATWLMDSGLFEKNIPLPPDRRRRALEQVRRLGYAFHVSQWRIARVQQKYQIEIVVENRGVAPFYADWPVELFARTQPAQPLARFKLTGILPGASVTWRALLDAQHQGRVLQLRVKNPMPGGKPLRFANREQDGHALVLGPWLNPE